MPPMGCYRQAATACGLVGKRRYKPPLHMIKLTQEREITP
jgi:hypothetical protein